MRQGSWAGKRHKGRTSGVKQLHAPEHITSVRVLADLKAVGPVAADSGSQ